MSMDVSTSMALLIFQFRCNRLRKRTTALFLTVAAMEPSPQSMSFQVILAARCDSLFGDGLVMIAIVNNELIGHFSPAILGLGLGGDGEADRPLMWF